MIVEQRTFEHPVRAGKVAVSVFERDGGYLVTEARDGATTVFATLGFFDGRDAALKRAAERALELERQQYRRRQTPS